ncbi:hypothetical protein B0H12DRAFT_1230639 [Mycena haematopus]|nr:hypothetical protein B0H12DRAFT_1230639 [Mycena haematopus]
MIPSFETIYDVKVLSTVSITEAMRPLLKNSGAILNISSQVAAQPQCKLRGTEGLWDSSGGGGDQGYNATNMNNYAGTVDPADGCNVIVQTALDKEGKSVEVQ